MAVLFRSVRLFVGMLCTCASAVLLTLLLQSTLGHKIGILTVNLGTIVFIVALSHLVYMTFNWQTLADRAASHRKGVTRSGAGWAADDVFAFALVDGLRIIRLCQLADCT